MNIEFVSTWTAVNVLWKKVKVGTMYIIKTRKISGMETCHVTHSEVAELGAF